MIVYVHEAARGHVTQADIRTNIQWRTMHSSYNSNSNNTNINCIAFPIENVCELVQGSCIVRVLFQMI